MFPKAVAFLSQGLQFTTTFFVLLFFIISSTAEGLTRENMSDVSGWQTFLQALGYFLKMFFGSAALGTLTGLISALISFFNTYKLMNSNIQVVFPLPYSPAFLRGYFLIKTILLVEDFSCLFYSYIIEHGYTLSCIRFLWT